MKKVLLYFIVFSIFSSNVSTANIQDPYFLQTVYFFNKIGNNSCILKKFIATLPKGGNLHTHFSGSIYPWNLIKYAHDDKTKSAWCFYKADNADVFFVKFNKLCVESGGTMLSEIYSNSLLYLNILKTWSLLDYQLKFPEYAHDHFFRTFNFASAITSYQKNRIKMLADLIKQAHHENLLYLELMVNPDISLPKNSSAVFAKLYLKKEIGNINIKSINTMIKVLNKHNFIRKIVKNNIILKTDSMLQQARRSLNCLSNKESSLCDIVVKFQYQALRTLPINETFATLYAGFLSVKLDPKHFVGVNLVGPEDNPLALKFYKKQMKIIKILKKLFPKTHVSLHAGELTKNLVSTKNMKFHIYDALKIADANRIGHGVDIWSEQKADNNVFNIMKKENKLVEINLSSNEAILGVCDGKKYCTNPEYKGKYNHPFYSYLKMGVPIALSTDDQGILLTNLSEEYYKAEKRYHISYSILKNIDRNSLSYSFLPGCSLWEKSYHGNSNWNYHNLAKPCANDNPYVKRKITSSCANYLDRNIKARLQWNLEVAFAKFEAKILHDAGLLIENP